MTMFNKVTKTFQYGQHTVTMETGQIARQASGAVVLSMDETVVLATVVAKEQAKSGQDFFPLTVDYIEKVYAAGRIPGGFFRREGRPSEKDTLTSRLIDRPLRPLFPEGFYNEVQVVVQVISSNPEVNADIPALLAASAALRPRTGPDHGGWPRPAGRDAGKLAQADRHGHTGNRDVQSQRARQYRLRPT